MPIYQYRCPNDHETERSATFAQFERTLTCPVCGVTAKLVLSPATVVYHGPGWSRPSTTRRASTDEYD